MPEKITQDQRLLAVFTPLDVDTLLIDSFVGTEGVSRPFRFELQLLADVVENMHLQVKAHELVGKTMTVRLKTDDDAERYFTGIVKRFRKDDQDLEFAYYTAEIVPWFDLLTLRSNCRIFVNKTVPDIIEAVVGDAGFSANYQANLTKTYTAWDYCVQYRETDFNFLSRLMEAEGIYYYFEHTDGDHKMMTGDATSCYQPVPVKHEYRYSPVTGIKQNEDTVQTWSAEERLHPGKATMRDYHLEMPANSLEVTEPSPDVADLAKSFEVFDFPGDYAKKFNQTASRLSDVRPEGEKVVRLDMEEDETTHVVLRGSSSCRTLTSGYKFNVTGGEAEGEYFLTGLHHRVMQQPHYRNRPENPQPYENSFVCIPSSVPYVPTLATPRPIAHGPQTAVVIDESSSGHTEEIWPDKYGRVRVRFFWDREAEYACWLRVSQPWASKTFGHVWIPRVGDEVVVGFLDGDPDRPIVTGSVYNADNMPPWTLPDNKTQTGIKTRSSMKGSSSNYNQIRFEDLKGSEEVNFQAEKDLNSLIKNNETRKVGNDRTTTIHNNNTRTVEEGNETLTVTKGKRDTTIHGDDTRTVEVGNDTLTVKMGNRKATISMGNETLEVSMGNMQTTVSLGGITTKSPAGTNETDALMVKINGMTMIQLTCGASSIQMTPASISISAPMVLINS